MEKVIMDASNYILKNGLVIGLVVLIITLLCKIIIKNTLKSNDNYI